MLMASTSSFTVVMLLMHLQLLIDAQESSFTITSDCACPGQTIVLECTVSTTSENAGGSTVWKGDFFRECDSTNNNIVLLHSRFTTVTTSGASNSITSCNNGSIISQILRVDPENETFISQLMVIFGLEMIGQKIICEYDSSPTMINTSSVNLKLVQTQTQNEEVDFNVTYVDLLMDSASKRVISFSWNQLNVSQAGYRCVLVPNHFTILSSSCGICHNNSNIITNQRSLNCTDVPVDAERCLFVLIPTICGGPAFQSSTFVNIDLRPKKGIFMNADVIEKKDTGLMAACVILTLIILILLMLIGITLLLRFKDHTIIKRMISFPNQLITNFTSRSALSVAYTNCNQTTEAQTNISQYEEINIYSHLHESSRQEDNDRVLKIFDNEDKERGIYGLADEIEDAPCTLSANANTQSEREASTSDVCTRAADKPTWEDMTEAQQKIKLRQELTSSEFEDADTPPPKPPR